MERFCLHSIYNFPLDEVFPLAHCNCMKLFAQIASVIGALSLLVGFVVYSQQRVGQPEGSITIAPTRASTNAATSVAPDPAVAPAPKALIPLVPRAEPKPVPLHRNV